MFKCHVCGSTEAYADVTDEVFVIHGKHVLVENIPVTRCARCGEVTFSRSTTEHVRHLVHEIQPVKTIKLDVFAFA